MSRSDSRNLDLGRAFVDVNTFQDKPCIFVVTTAFNVKLMGVTWSLADAIRLTDELQKGAIGRPYCEPAERVKLYWPEDVTMVVRIEYQSGEHYYVARTWVKSRSYHQIPA